MHTHTVRYKAIFLRKRGYSYTYISKRIGINKSTLSGWLAEVPYVPNKVTLATIGKARAASSEYKAKQVQASFAQARKEAKRTIRSVSSRDLFMFGLALYLGEGTKTANVVRMVNADPKIIKTMIQWFLLVGVSNDQFAPRIHLYPDSDQEESLQFWSKLTNIPKAQFHTSYIDRRVDKKPKKQGKLPYGTLHLGVRSNGKKEFGTFFSRKIHAWNEEVLRQIEMRG